MKKIFLCCLLGGCSATQGLPPLAKLRAAVREVCATTDTAFALVESIATPAVDMDASTQNNTEAGISE